MNDYASRCPVCGDFLIIRINSIDCVNSVCGYVSPRKACDIENLTEVRKPGEERFVPPKRIPHPNGRTC